MYALLSLVGRSIGFDRLPLPRAGSRSTPLLDVETAVDGVCTSGCVPGPVRMNLLSHCCPRINPEALEPIAMSLIRSDLDSERQPHARHLLERAHGAEAGADPFGRRSALLCRRPKTEVRRQAAAPTGDADYDAEPDLEAGAVVQEARDAFVDVSPTCSATTQMVGGFPALSISTTLMSRQPFEEARAMTDPLFWSQCPPQNLFFKEMKVLGAGKSPLPDGAGWSARILEVVDFSYGLDDSGESEMRTELDFVYFESEYAAGCTYDLHRSLDREILVDRGFVMVENLRSIDWRRTTTLKQVFFRSRSHPGDVCQFWSLAQGMASSSCSTQSPAT